MPLEVWPLWLHGRAPAGGPRVSICFLPDAFCKREECYCFLLPKLCLTGLVLCFNCLPVFVLKGDRYLRTFWKKKKVVPNSSSPK